MTTATELTALAAMFNEKMHKFARDIDEQVVGAVIGDSTTWLTFSEVLGPQNLREIEHIDTMKDTCDTDRILVSVRRRRDKERFVFVVDNVPIRSKDIAKIDLAKLILFLGA